MSDLLMDLHVAETAFARRKADLASGSAQPRLVRPEPACPERCRQCDFRCAVSYAIAESIRLRICAAPISGRLN